MKPFIIALSVCLTAGLSGTVFTIGELIAMGLTLVVSSILIII